MRRFLNAALTGAGAALFCFPWAAHADNGWGNTTCTQSPSPVCALVAGNRPDRPAGTPHQDQSGTSEGTDPASSDFGCRHVPVDYPAPSGSPEGPGGWFMVLCSPDGKDPDSHGPVWIAAGEQAATVSPEQVAQMARRQLRLRAPVIAASPTGTQLVRLPTWLWLSDGWSTSSATASVPGVSVTASATPSSVTWSMGDGVSATCAGPGTPYTGAADPKSSSPDCGHTYLWSSAGEPRQAFAVSATVRWTITWSGAGQSGTFPDLTTTSSAALRVAESHALNNGAR